VSRGVYLAFTSLTSHLSLTDVLPHIYIHFVNRAKRRFIVFVGGPEEERWTRENYRCGAIVQIGFVEGPQKWKDGSRIDRIEISLYNDLTS
jgi:hypothetical protein